MLSAETLTTGLVPGLGGTRDSGSGHILRRDLYAGCVDGAESTRIVAAQGIVFPGLVKSPISLNMPRQGFEVTITARNQLAPKLV